jgi:hypothetical protein
MAYALKNSIIYNEAFAAYIFAKANAVASAGTPPSDNPVDPTGAAYTGTALMTEATAFAEAVDTAIENDTTISDVGGVALQPATQVIQQHQLGKSAAIRGACYAFLCPGGSWLNWMPGGPVIAPATGRGTTKLGGNRAGGNTTWITNVGNQILELYTAMIAIMSFPAPGG